QTTLLLCPAGKVGTYTISDNVTIVGDSAFRGCRSLTNITIPDSVRSIDFSAFYECTSLSNLTIPKKVTSVRSDAFAECRRLTGVYFEGNAPSDGGDLFNLSPNAATVYYLPGTTGWGPAFGGRPTAPWRPQVETGDSSFGVRTNQFGFNIT